MADLGSRVPPAAVPMPPSERDDDGRFVVRYYQSVRLGPDGNYCAGPRSHLHRDLDRVLGCMPDYAVDPVALLIGRAFVARLRYATCDQRGLPLTPRTRYSVIDALILGLDVIGFAIVFAFGGFTFGESHLLLEDSRDLSWLRWLGAALVLLGFVLQMLRAWDR